MKIFAKTDIGLVRSTNEDTFTYIVKDEKNFIAFVCDGERNFFGTITDGDIRRHLIKNGEMDTNVMKVMNRKPYVVQYPRNP